MRSKKATARKVEVAGHARQEEGGAQAREERGQGAQAGHRSRHQDRLRRLAQPWWERRPARVEKDSRELTKAGFRVHRRVQGDRLLLDVQGASKERFLVAYPLFDTEWGTATFLGPGGAMREASLGGGALDAIQHLQAGQGYPVTRDFSAPPIFVPMEWSRPISGAGGDLVIGQALIGPDGYAAKALSGVRELIDAPGLEFARAFPRRRLGLWARGELPDEREATTEKLVGAAEQILARAHGLTDTEIRTRLRTEVGAIATSLRHPDGTKWRFVARTVDGGPLVLAWHEYDAREFDARAPYSSQLAGRKVVIVGCGSVGWSVALGLARSGVSLFALYDSDMIAAANLPRLDTYLGATGRNKAEALAEHLQTVAPHIEATGHAEDIGIDQRTRALVDEKPDLIVNLSGEEISTDETNLAALILKTPALFGWVSNGVVAGRIFRVRPGHSACYECVREAEPAQIPSRGPVPMEPHPWSGAYFDIEAFAAAVTRAAIRTLLREPVSRANPDHVVLTFGGAVPTARQVHIPRDADCPVCR